MSTYQHIMPMLYLRTSAGQFRKVGENIVYRDTLSNQKKVGPNIKKMKLKARENSVYNLAQLDF